MSNRSTSDIGGQADRTVNTIAINFQKKLVAASPCAIRVYRRDGWYSPPNTFSGAI